MSFDEGVDVASYQPKNYVTSGLDFAFVKSTEGTSYVNPEHDAQVSTIENAGGLAGHYLFMHPGNVAAQANYFATKTKVKPGDLIAIDWESENGVWPSNADKDSLIKAVKARFPHNRVGLYTNRDGWLNHDRTSYCGDFLWIADPTTAGKPRIKHAWTFHQYSTANGIDHDVANFQTLADLKKWAGVPVTETPIKPNATYSAVMLEDVVPTPKGHSDSDTDKDGGDFWTLQTFLVSLYAQVQDIQTKVNEIHAKVLGE